MVALKPETDVGPVAAGMRKWVDAHAVMTADLPIDDGVLTSFELVANGSYRARTFEFGDTTVLGHVPTDYDPTALVAAIRDGRAVVDHVPDVEFAVALWQPECPRLTLVRDTAGARAMYYVHEPCRWVAFASTPEPLMELDGVRDTIDEAMLPSILVIGVDAPLNATVFSRLRRVPAAHCVSFDANGATQHRYWRLTGRPDRRRDDSVPARMRALLSSAVERRTRGTNHSAAQLSGGLDSSTVAALAYRNRAPTDRLSLVRFDSYDESGTLEDPEEAELARALAAQLADADLHVIRLDRPDSIAAISDQQFLDRPLPEMAYARGFDQRLIVAAAELGCQRLLTGWGGDEMASHRSGDYALSMLFERRWLTLSRTLRSAGLKLGLKALLWNQWRDRRSGLPFLERDEVDTALSLFAGRPLEDAVRNEFDGTIERPEIRSRRRMTLENPFLHLGMETFDWIGQRAGVEIAHPLFDRALVEFCDRMPIEWVAVHGEPRRAFRRAVADLLPSEAVDRRKTQLAAPTPNLAWRRRYYGQLETALTDLIEQGNWVGGFIDLGALLLHLTKTDDASNRWFLRQIAANTLVLAGVEI